MVAGAAGAMGALPPIVFVIKAFFNSNLQRYIVGRKVPHLLFYRDPPPILFTLHFQFFYSWFCTHYSCAEVIYLLIRFSKTETFLWNTKNADRNCVNTQKTWKIRKPPFLKTKSDFFNPSLLWEQSETPLFWKILKTQTPLFIKKGIGGPKLWDTTEKCWNKRFRASKVAKVPSFPTM